MLQGGTRGQGAYELGQPGPGLRRARSDRFVAALLGSTRRNRFLADFMPVARRVAHFGMLNSLSQTLVKLASPGVPDIYQGNELWDFSLVDPDNRRRVDYGTRDALLRDLEVRLSPAAPDHGAELRGLLDAMTDGRVKLYLMWRTLQVRRRMERLFREGDYLPLTPAGAAAEHVFAFARRLEDEAIIVVVPRLCARLLGEGGGMPTGDVWGDTELRCAALGVRTVRCATNSPARLWAVRGALPPRCAWRTCSEASPSPCFRCVSPAGSAPGNRCRPTDKEIAQ